MRRRTVFLLVLVVLGVAAAGAYVAWRLARRAVDTTVEGLTQREEKTVDLGALVTHVRELSRLETASMRVLQVSTTTQSYKLIPNAVGGEELTFLAAGDVIAGVDLSRIQRTDVWQEADGTLVMRLPPSQILMTRVDNRESRVISRKTGLLRRADVNLESRARQRAEQAIRNESIKKGILVMASQNAEKKLADFLHTVGFQKVRFEKSALARPAA